MTKKHRNPYRRADSPYWHILYVDASGRQRRESTRCKDLQVARQLLAQRQREAAQRRAGMVDPYAETRNRPLSVFVDAFRQHLQDAGNVPHYVQQVVRRLRHVIEQTGAVRLGDLKTDDAEKVLAEIRKTRSAKVRDDYAADLRAFGAWLLIGRKWPENPFAPLKARVRTKADRQFKRKPLTYNEVQRLAEATLLRAQQNYAKTHRGNPLPADLEREARARQILYWFAATTGFRAAECGAVRWSDLALDGDRPEVRLAGANTKNREDARIPLQPFMAAALRAWRIERSRFQLEAGDGPVREDDRVFRVPEGIAALVRKDAKFAGLVTTAEPTARRLDFHGLRGSCAVILVQLGVHPKFVQQVLRHSDIRLTMDTYADVGEDLVAEAVQGRVPVPDLFRGLCTDLCTSPIPAEAQRGTMRHDDTIPQGGATRDSKAS